MYNAQHSDMIIRLQCPYIITIITSCEYRLGLKRIAILVLEYSVMTTN